jgi:acetyl-CoA carboxylase carboxyl transferase subunit alpha
MAEALKLTAGDLYKLGIINEIVEEPLGGSQADFEATAQNLKNRIHLIMQELVKKDRKELVKERYQKLRAIGILNDGIL